MSATTDRQPSGAQLEALSTTPLDRDGSTPIFEQIRERISTAIRDGVFLADQRLPSEARLGEELGVSRMTVRQAIDALVADGLLYRRPAYGTFIADRHIRQPLTRLTSFTEDITARGMRPSSRILSQTAGPAPFEIAQLFHLPPGSRVIQLIRLRLADDEPLALERVHLPSAFAPGIEAHDFASVSLYQVLRDEYGLVLSTAHQTMEAALPSAEEQAALGIAATSPVLRIFRLTHDADGRVIEYVRSAYRGDRYQLSVDLG